MYVKLPYLGRVFVKEDDNEDGHYLWRGNFGWHDCTHEEDNLIKKAKG